MDFPVNDFLAVSNHSISGNFASRVDEVFGELVCRHKEGRIYHRPDALAPGWQGRLQGVAGELWSQSRSGDEEVAETLKNFGNMIIDPEVPATARQKLRKSVENWMLANTDRWLKNCDNSRSR